MPGRDDLIDLIDAEEETNLKFLQKLVQTPSPNPPGDTKHAVAVVREFLTSHGIGVELIAPKPDSPNLVSFLHDDKNGDHRRLVLNGHIDHFPVENKEAWQRDPYSGDIDNGFIHGCGSVDMKAGTAASIIAFAYLYRFRSKLPGQAVLEVVSDEETGGKFGTRYLLEHDSRMELFRGTCVLNAEPGGVESIRFAEKGTLRMTFEVNCEGGHGAYTNRTEGAIRIATRTIARLLELEDLRGDMDPSLQDYLTRPDVRQVADSIMGSGAAKLMFKPSVNIGTIRGGVKVNMIPSSCVFEVDIRLPIGLDAETVLSKINNILEEFSEVTYKVQQAATNPPAASPLEHTLVRLLQRNGIPFRGSGTEPLAICSLGATDCKHFRYHDIPAYTFGPSPETMAGKDERVSVQEFLDVVKLHTVTAWDYLK
jgi:acetylornithine deacetylase/succinyl-diaminopimelate desuccinylase-like protein